MMTFAQAKSSNIANIAGVGTDSTQFKAYINEAIERLMSRGDFDGLVIPACFCVKNGCVVFPRWVDSIREAKVCNGSLNIKNEWYEFIQGNWRWYQSQYSGTYWNYQDCQSNMLGGGRVPTHNTIMGTARKVRAYPQVNQDFGKTLTIFGTDNAGQPLMHRNAAGNWEPGVVLTLQTPYAETEGYVSSIDRVDKEVTQKPVTLWAWNTTDSVLEDLAVYDPGETLPAFAKYRLNTGPNKDEDGNERKRSFAALVKIRYIPVEFDTDYIPLTMPALKLCIAGIKQEEGGDYQSAETSFARAVRELNHTLQDRNPGNQVSVNSNSVGNMLVSPI
jgi:hypothetical protein